MKKLLILLAFFCAFSPAFSQYLYIYDIDTSAFPIMKAKFIATDKNGNKIQGLSPDNIIIREDGIERKVTSVNCPSSEPRPLSVVFSFDISSSMGELSYDNTKPFDLARMTARKMIGNIYAPPSEFALQTCDDHALLLNDFTSNKSDILTQIDNIQLLMNNNFDTQLLDSTAGLLNIAKNGRFDRYAVILTDGIWYSLFPQAIQRCKDTCSKYNIKLITLIYAGSGLRGLDQEALRAISLASNGIFLDSVITRKLANDAADFLANILQDNNVCTVEWISEPICHKTSRLLSMEIPDSNLAYQRFYQVPDSFVMLIDIQPVKFHFPAVKPNSRRDTLVSITAINHDINITGFNAQNGFSVSPGQFFIKAGETKQIKISYISPDTSFAFSEISIDHDGCQSSLYASAGFLDRRLPEGKIKVVFPNGGEEFRVGGNARVLWDNASDADSAFISYSFDAGRSWHSVVNTINKSDYSWINLPNTPSRLCLMKAYQNSGSSLGVDMIKNLGIDGFGPLISWSPDARRLSSYFNSRLMTWDLDNDSLEYSVRCYSQDFLNAPPSPISWSPDGCLLAFREYDNNIIIADAFHGDTLSWLATGNVGYFYDIQWRPDCKKLAGACFDRVINIWDVASATLEKSLDRGSGIILSIAWSPDGALIASGRYDSMVDIWNVDSSKCLFTITNHKKPVTKVAWSPNGSLIASASYDNKILFINPRTGSVVDSIMTGYEYGISSICWSPDGAKIACTGFEPAIKIFDFPSKQLIKQFSYFDSTYSNVAWSSDGYKLLTGSLVWQLNDITMNEDISDNFWSIVAECTPFFKYDDFSNPKNLSFAGFAQKYNNVIKLTPSKINQSGAVWHNKPVFIGDGFSTSFSFRMGNGSNYNCDDLSLPGADGLAFVIKSNPVVEFGLLGGGIGYDGITGALAVEFDTFNNDSTQIVSYKDPNGNHVAVQSCGSAPVSASHTGNNCLGINPRIVSLKSDSTVYYAMIDYCDKNLVVYIDSTKSFSSPALVIPALDLESLLNLPSDSAYFGISSATGCSYETHDLLNWSVCNYGKSPLGIQPQSEPGPSLFRCYPNPSGGRVNFDFSLPLPSNVSISIFNDLGSEIQSFDFNNIQNHSFAWLPDETQSGIFMARININGTAFTQKIILLP